MQILAKFIVIIFFILFWQFGAFWSEYLIPTPLKTLRAFMEVFASIVVGIKSSFFRYFWGLIIGSLLGIIVAFLLNINQNILKAFDPLINLLRPISPIAWIPLVVIVFGLGDKPTIFIIAYAVFFPMLLITTKAINEVSDDLIKTAKGFGANKFQIVFGIIYPSTFFSILTGLKLVASLAWINLVVGEMVGAQSGLG
ncbi:MAG: ABC transporter permease subunit, partial [Campylobacter sp.]|nr:ABC transporter permease subunit [Campylobacter sp.]